jgi:hypothetical protein
MRHLTSPAPDLRPSQSEQGGEQTESNAQAFTEPTGRAISPSIPLPQCLTELTNYGNTTEKKFHSSAHMLS